MQLRNFVKGFKSRVMVAGYDEIDQQCMYVNVMFCSSLQGFK